MAHVAVLKAPGVSSLKSDHVGVKNLKYNGQKLFKKILKRLIQWHGNYLKLAKMSKIKYYLIILKGYLCQCNVYKCI